MPQEETALLPLGVTMECTGNDSETDSYEEEDGSDQHTSGFFSQESEDLPSSQESNESDVFPTDEGATNALIDGLEFVFPSSPKPKVAFAETLVTTVEDISSHLNPVTPKKPGSEIQELDPLTPTANLKMLISAASPEIRNREKVKEYLKIAKQADSPLEEEDEKDIEWEDTSKQTSLKRTSKKQSQQAFSRNKLDSAGSAGDEVVESECFDAVTAGGSRKEKSLGLLCQRFLQKYPIRPGPLDRIEICLDEVAKDLCVERRRIYDIVNVLESVEIVSRLAKNRYTWHGKTNLQHTLIKLKSLAEVEGFVEQIEHIRDLELGRDGSTTSGSQSKKIPLKNLDELNLQETGTKYTVRKDKSLGIMSQKFLMLFLVAKNQTVNLDMAAKILIGDPNIDKTENAKFKTKIRRLYDIANILTSLDLVRKVHVTEVRGRKPAFKYVGPSLTDVKEIPACSDDGHHRPSSRHSLLDCVQNPQVCGIMSQPACGKPRVAAKKSFSRHASFDQICAVAAQERDRLYFESNSQPSSPTKTKAKRPLLPRTKSMPPPPAFSGNTTEGTTKPAKSVLTKMMPLTPVSTDNNSALKHFMVIRPSPQTPGANKEAVSIQKLPIQAITLTQADANPQNTAGKIVLKTQTTKGSEKQPTMIKIHKSQLESMLKTLKNNNNNNSRTSCNYVDVSTQSSPDTGNLVSLIQKDKIKVVEVVKMMPASQGKQVTPHNMLQLKQQGVVVGGETPLVKTTKRPADKDVAGAECYFGAKRPRKEEKVDYSMSVSSSQDAEVARITQKSVSVHKPKRLSPMRALHLDPEFRSSPLLVEKTPSPPALVQPTLPSPSLSEERQFTPPGELCPTSLPQGVNTLQSSTSELAGFLEGESISGLVTPTESSQKGCVTPTLHLSSTSSPVMLLAATSASLGSVPHISEPQMGTNTVQFFTTPTSIQPGIRQAVAGRARSGSPASLTLSSSGIAALQSSEVFATPNSIVSESPLDLTTNTIRPVRGIAPSSAILNLVPHLTDSPPEGTKVNIQNIGSKLVHQIANESLLKPTTITISSNTVSPMLTPQDRIYGNNIIPPSQMTPSTQQLTPGSFFRSTPGGIVHTGIVQQMCQRNNGSAFQLVSSQQFTPITETISTARRLNLTQLPNTS